jgi:predicted GTPase
MFVAMFFNFQHIWQAEKRVATETRELLVSLDEKQKGLTEYHTNIVNIKMYASELQTFLAVNKIEKDVETQDKSLQSIVYLLLQFQLYIFNWHRWW